MSEAQEYLATILNFRKVCKDFGTRRVLDDLRHVDLNFYNELMGKNDIARKVPALCSSPLT